LKGNFVDANKEAEKITGYNKDELLGKSFLKLPILPKKEIHKVTKLLMKNMSGKPTGPDEFTLIRKDGIAISVEIITYAVKINNSMHVLGIARDITEVKKAQHDILLSQEKFRTIFNNANDCILIHDLEGNILELNDKARKRLGHSSNDLSNGSLPEENLPEYFKKIKDMKNELYKNGGLIFESVSILKNGKKIPVEISSKIIDYNGGKAVLSISRDISERKKIEELIRELAYKDILTNLPNRVLFNEQFKIVKANSERNNKKFAIMLIDIDNFKLVNDNLGHNIGDELLKNVGERFISILRKEDVVARIGGDEFSLLIPEIKSIEDAEKVAEKLVNSFQQRFIILNHAVSATLSIGISIFPDDGRNYNTLTKKADTAMYQAKQSGRNNYRVF